MNLPEISVHRHVMAYMLSGLLVLFGLISFERIGSDRFPKIEPPMLSVTTHLPGASPEIMNSSVTNLIEEVVNSVPGIEHITSSSGPGRSVINVKFFLEKDIDVAFNETQTKINQILPDLPDDADPPVVAKVEFGSLPIMWLTLTGDRTLQQLNQYARNVVKKRLETIEGIGEVRLGGERERTIRVNLDSQRMAAFGITIQDIVAAFSREHVRLPGGFLVGERFEDLVKLDLEFHSIKALADLIVAYPEGAPIRLGDIATLEDGLADFRQLAHYNTQPAVGIGLVKVNNANTVAIVREVNRRLDSEIRPQLPPGMTISIAHNDSDLIEAIVHGLEEHLLSATLLTALVVLFFLKNLRSTLIIAAAIPVSLLGTIAVMYFLDYTFNTLTLLALLLLIGVVVDDSIVVLENIYRYREKFQVDAVTAALNGTQQVMFAVIASTLTLVAIFVTVIFLQGIVGQLFRSFGVVVTFGVLVSLLVSLTLTPMLCARHLQISTDHGLVYRLFERGFQLMDRVYTALLTFALRYRWTMMVVTIVIVCSSGYFFANMGKSFFPVQDESRFLITFKAPLGSSIETANRKLIQIEEVLAGHKEITGQFATIGLNISGQVNEGQIIVQMLPRNKRSKSQAVLIEQLRQEFAGIPGVEAFPSEMPLIGGRRGEPLSFELVGPDLNEVARLAQNLKQKLNSSAVLGNVDLELQLDLPQLELAVSREKIEAVGLSVNDVAMAVNVLVGGFDVARYNDPGDGERYDVRLKARAGDLQHLPDLGRIYLRAMDGEMVRLDNLVRPKPNLGPAVISRFDLQYAARFFSTPTISLADAINIVNEEAEKLISPGYQVKMTGRAQEFGKTAGYMLFAFITSIILVYMVLASQFNSFIQPFIIMIAQPLAIVGGGALLWLTGHSLNMFSMIGLVLLIGLVAKNSILLVDLTNQLRREGNDIDAALMEACPIRLRPVLMTSCTIILALLPAALGYGADSDTSGPLAVAVIGGMISSTLLTLVIVPAAYSLVEHGLVGLKQKQETSLDSPVTVKNTI